MRQRNAPVPYSTSRAVSMKRRGCASFSLQLNVDCILRVVNSHLISNRILAHRKYRTELLSQREETVTCADDYRTVRL